MHGAMTSIATKETSENKHPEATHYEDRTDLRDGVVLPALFGYR